MIRPDGSTYTFGIDNGFDPDDFDDEGFPNRCPRCLATAELCCCDDLKRCPGCNLFRTLQLNNIRHRTIDYTTTALTAKENRMKLNPEKVAQYIQEFIDKTETEKATVDASLAAAEVALTTAITNVEAAIPADAKKDYVNHGSRRDSRLTYTITVDVEDDGFRDLVKDLSDAQSEVYRLKREQDNLEYSLAEARRNFRVVSAASEPVDEFTYSRYL